MKKERQMIDSVVVMFSDCKKRKCFSLGQFTIHRGPEGDTIQPDLCCITKFNGRLSDNKFPKECE